MIKRLIGDFMVENSTVLSAQEQDKLYKIAGRFGEVVSRVEDRMFADYPSLPNTYLDVFYGTFTGSIRNDVDEKVRKEAERILKEKYIK